MYPSLLRIVNVADEANETLLTREKLSRVRVRVWSADSSHVPLLRYETATVMKVRTQQTGSF